jgi:transcriptional regulator with XRE-family HTH domain
MPVPVTPDELHARVASRIRELAKARGLAIEKLADKSGLSQGHLWNVLSGRFQPTLKVIAKLAAGLEVDPLELLRPVGTAPDPEVPARVRRPSRGG